MTNFDTARYRADPIFRKKQLARLRVRGLARQPCERCGRRRRVQAHHDDYDKPLEVRWLCPPHHREWHAAHGPGRVSGAR